MSESNLLTLSHEHSRNFRSHSLKNQSQPFLLPPRPKRRTLSLPCKPVIPPFIVIQGCRDNQETESEEEELDCDPNKESMGETAGKFNFVCLFVCLFFYNFGTLGM